MRECPLTAVARVADLVAAGDSAVHADDPAGHEVAFDDIDHGASDLGGCPKPAERDDDAFLGQLVRSKDRGSVRCTILSADCVLMIC